jgi:hypothetical protein
MRSIRLFQGQLATAATLLLVTTGSLAVLPTPAGAADGVYDKPITANGLEFTISKPVLNYSQSVKVEFEVRSIKPGEHKIPDPKLKCAKKTYPIDQNSANYAPKLSDAEADSGTWAWETKGKCAKGSFKVGNVTFRFDNLKPE